MSDGPRPNIHALVARSDSEQFFAAIVEISKARNEIRCELFVVLTLDQKIFFAQPLTCAEEAVRFFILL